MFDYKEHEEDNRRKKSLSSKDENSDENMVKLIRLEQVMCIMR